VYTVSENTIDWPMANTYPCSRLWTFISRMTAYSPAVRRVLVTRKLT
jgi:hypothetical protein